MYHRCDFSVNLRYEKDDEICGAKLRYRKEAVSAEVKDLIQSCLRIRPKDRIQLEDILAHPWLTSRRGGAAADDDDGIVGSTVRPPCQRSPLWLRPQLASSSPNMLTSRESHAVTRDPPVMMENGKRSVLCSGAVLVKNLFLRYLKISLVIKLSRYMYHV